MPPQHTLYWSAWFRSRTQCMFHFTKQRFREPIPDSQHKASSMSDLPWRATAKNPDCYLPIAEDLPRSRLQQFPQVGLEGKLMVGSVSTFENSTRSSPGPS